MESKKGVIASSQLIINGDDTIFHLHLKPEDICDKIILVGDPARVDMIASLFDKITFEQSSREFRTKKGLYRGVEMMILSTGIGTDNIDIVLNELDALANIDFKSRTPKASHRTLTIVRIGTTGSVQQDIKLGELILSETSIGIDCLAAYYKERKNVCDIALEEEFMRHMQWDNCLPRPYAVNSSKELITLFSSIATKGITISAPGFYAPQGRSLRLEPTIKDIIDRFENFSYNLRHITNIEMESSAIAFLSAMLGHKAITMCVVVAQRKTEDSNPNYQDIIKEKIELILNKLSK